MAKWPDPEFEPEFDTPTDTKPAFDLEPDFAPLELKKPLARGKASDLGDVTGVADALADLGAYDKGRHGNPPLVPETLFRSIEDFQKDQGLDVDGVMLPNGPTLGRINALLPKARPRNLRSDGLQSPKPTSKMPAGEDDDGPSFADLYKQRLEVGEPQGFGPAFAPFEREFSARPSIPTRPGPRSDRATAAAVPGAAPPPPALLASRREPHLPQSDGAPREPLEATSRLPDVDNLVGTLIAETAPSFGETSALGKFDGDASVDDDRIFESWRDRIRARIRHLERDGTITSERAELLLAQFEGHHYFPQQIFNHLDLSPDAREAFRQGTTGLTDRHVNDAAHRQYTAAVREMWEQWVRERGINPAQMTRAQAEEFLRAIRSSTNPTIRNFNNEIRFRQIPALRNGLRWWRGR